MVQAENVIPSSILGAEYTLEFRKDGLCASKQSNEEKLFRYTLKSEVLDMVGLNGLETWQAKVILLKEKRLTLTLLDDKERFTTLKFIRLP